VSELRSSVLQEWHQINGMSPVMVYNAPHTEDYSMGGSP